METPFPFEAPAEGRAFCDREAELSRLASRLADGAWPVVGGVAGSGLTSLSRALSDRVRGTLAGATLDLWPVEGARSFRRRLAKDEPESGPDGGGDDRPLLAAVRRWLGDVLPGEPAGSVLVLDGAGWLAEDDAEPVRSALVEAAEERPELRLVSFGSGPARLRSLARKLGAASGRSGDDVPFLRLRPIPLPAWMPFVLERFLETDRWIANEQVEAAVELTGGHARYTQLLFHLLWRRCGEGGRVEDADLSAAADSLLARAGRPFDVLWGTLSANQRRVTWGLAVEPDPRPFSSDFVARHDLSSPSSAQRALSSLVASGVVEKTDGDYRFPDPLFPRWLRWRAGGPAVGAGG